MKTWHYVDPQNQKQQAPESELGALIQEDQITPNSLVWSQGMTQWTPAGQVLGNMFQAGMAPQPGGPPPVPHGTPQKCHEVDYEIFGDDMQIVEVELDPGETVVAEAGAMNYLEDGISFETKMGDGSQADEGIMGKLLSVGKRALTGESIFMTHFTHQGGGAKRRVAFAAPYPGKIVPINMAEVGGELTCQKDAFLCAAFGTQISIAFNRKLGAGFFGGEGFILQKLRGDGMAFVHAGGTVTKRELQWRNPPRRYRLYRGVFSRHRVRHPARRQPEVDVLRR